MHVRLLAEFHWFVSGTGIYWLVYTTEKFHVQEWHTPYAVNTAVEVNKAVYVRYADTFVVAYGNNANNSIHVVVNGRAFNLMGTSGSSVGVNVVQQGNVVITPQYVSFQIFSYVV